MGYNLTQINPAYELVSDVIVSTATTTVDFTGLNIAKEDDYMLVSTTYAGTNADLEIFANNNATSTNYCWQYIYAYTSSVSATRINNARLLYFNSGAYSLSIAKLKLTNNGYFIWQNNVQNVIGGSANVIQNYYGTSTFTMSSIASITLKANVSNAIGIGSRFQLYKRVAPVVFDYTVSSAQTSVDITGLSIDKGSEYMLVSEVMNNTASGSSYSLYVNNNTIATNYYEQHIVANGTSVSSARTNSIYVVYASPSDKSFSASNIKLTNNGYVINQSNTMGKHGSANVYMENIYSTSTFTATSITQLTITASVSNAIGIGSRFQLIKLK